METGEVKLVKQSFISTTICLVGSSIGTISAILFLSNEHWFFILLLSLGSGFFTSMLAILFWELLFRKKSLADAIKESYSLSIVSILIMILSVNIIFSITPELLPDQTERDSAYGLMILSFGMILAFVLAFGFHFWKLKNDTNSEMRKPIKH